MTATTSAVAPTTTAAGRAAPGGRFRMIAKGLRLLWTYRATLIPTLLSMTIMYVLVQYFVGGGKVVDELVAETAPGMFAYVVIYLTIDAQ